MYQATVHVSRYISARGIVVAEYPSLGLVTIRDGATEVTGQPIPMLQNSAAAA